MSLQKSDSVQVHWLRANAPECNRNGCGCAAQWALAFAAWPMDTPHTDENRVTGQTQIVVCHPHAIGLEPSDVFTLDHWRQMFAAVPGPKLDASSVELTFMPIAYQRDPAQDSVQ